MASDFAPVQPQYLNLADIYGKAEEIKTARMQQAYLAAKARESDLDAVGANNVRRLYAGGRKPSYEEMMAADPALAQQSERLNIDRMNAENGRLGEIQKVTKEAAQNALKMWENTGRDPGAWNYILGETGRQLRALGMRHPNGHLVGEEIDPEKIRPETLMQIAGWQDPMIEQQRAATAEGLKAEAKARAEFPYDVAKEQAKPQRMQQPRPVDPLLNEKRRLEIEKAKREQADKESGMNLTESQAKHTNYAMRMNEAEKNIQALEAEGYTPDAESVLGRAAGAVAGAAGFSPYAGLSDKGAKWMQAQDQWVNALLRSDTGAAYASYEPADLKRIFFAMPGESDEIKAQKAQQRKAAIEGILISSGKGRQRVEGYSAPQADTGGYSMEDLQHTAQKYGMTIEEVKAKLGAQ